MARYKPYDYSQMQMVPVALDQQLVPGTLEYAIHYLVEHRLDLALFDARYANDQTGCRAYAPKVLLKVILLGYARGLLSSRRLERACRENITVMALTCGQTPDHSTLATFVSSLHVELPAVFAQVLLVCEQEGLLGGTHFSLDGVKLPSNAAKESSGTFADLRQKQQALARKAAEALAEHRATDRRDGAPPGAGSETGPATPPAVPPRVARLHRQAERIEKFLATHEPKLGRRGHEVQSNVTDNESAKLASAHGVVQGYNANAVVDAQHQVVVYAEAFGRGDDAASVAPLLAGTAANLTAVGRAQPLAHRVLSADTGYYSVTNLQACAEFGVDAYIPDRHFRQRDVRFAAAARHRRATDKHKQRYRSTRRWFGPADFVPDPTTGRLVCPAGQKLYRNGSGIVTANGYRVSSHRSLARDCDGCALRTKCLRNLARGSTRQVRLFHGREPGSLTEAMKAKIDTPQGRAQYARRLGIVEPVFANLRAQKRLDRFTLRGRVKVTGQWRLYCLVHNLEKLAKHGLGRN
jgi:transposase/IS5 family transposase